MSKEYEVEVELDMKFVDTVKTRSKAEAVRKAFEKMHKYTGLLPAEYFVRSGFDNDELPVRVDGEDFYQ